MRRRSESEGPGHRDLKGRVSASNRAPRRPGGERGPWPDCGYHVGRKLSLSSGGSWEESMSLRGAVR